MIYPDISLEDFLKKYPDLKVMQKDCDNCKRKIIANIPFMTIDLVGLEAKKCLCGKNRFTCGMSITRTKKAFDEVAQILS